MIIHPRTIFISILSGIILIVLLIWVIFSKKNESRTQQTIASDTTSHQGAGNAEIVIDSLRQLKSGIAVETLPVTSHEERFKTYGTVVPVKQIAEVYRSHEAAKSQVAKATAVADASEKQYLREKDLFAKNLESEQNLQAAQAQWESDKASVEAAASAMLSLESSLRQQWGSVISRWILTGTEELHKVLSLQTVLVQVTLPGDQEFSMNPRAALLQPLRNENEIVSARFVSTARSVDPRFQGSVLFYLVPNDQNDLLGGMNVNVLLPTAMVKKGYVIPRSDAVWYQGSVWVYVKRDSNRFARLAIPTDQPVETGWFVSEDHAGFTDTIEIVTEGSQLLFFEEFRPHIQGAAGEGGKPGGGDKEGD